LIVSPATVHCWKQRGSPHDQSCHPHEVQYAFDANEAEALLLRCYYFAAIDRDTRLCFLAVYEQKNKKAATDLLKRIS